MCAKTGARRRVELGLQWRTMALEGKTGMIISLQGSLELESVPPAHPPLLRACRMLHCSSWCFQTHCWLHVLTSSGAEAFSPAFLFCLSKARRKDSEGQGQNGVFNHIHNGTTRMGICRYKDCLELQCFSFSWSELPPVLSWNWNKTGPASARKMESRLREAQSDLGRGRRNPNKTRISDEASTALALKKRIFLRVPGW